MEAEEDIEPRTKRGHRRPAGQERPGNPGVASGEAPPPKKACKALAELGALRIVSGKRRTTAPAIFFLGQPPSSILPVDHLNNLRSVLSLPLLPINRSVVRARGGGGAVPVAHELRPNVGSVMETWHPPPQLPAKYNVESLLYAGTINPFVVLGPRASLL